MGQTARIILSHQHPKKKPKTFQFRRFLVGSLLIITQRCQAAAEQKIEKENSAEWDKTARIILSHQHQKNNPRRSQFRRFLVSRGDKANFSSVQDWIYFGLKLGISKSYFTNPIRKCAKFHAIIVGLGGVGIKKLSRRRKSEQYEKHGTKQYQWLFIDFLLL